MRYLDRIAKRILDLTASFVGLILFLPVFTGLAIAIVMESKGGVFFRQKRVGLDGQHFNLLKFRSMFIASEQKSQITVGDRDPRITKVGYFIRKYKLDELAQLWNVLLGEMSLVGPRPEVPRYVALYTDEQKQLLSIKPGITDLASLYYFEEAKILANAEDPEEAYVNEVMPDKLSYSLDYLSNTKGRRISYP